MGLDFDFDQCPEDPSKIQDGGGDRPTPGRGMVLITEWNEYTGAKGKAHELVYEIVAWTNPGDIAKQHKENIFHTDTTGKGFPMRRLTCLAMAAGLFNALDVIAWKKAGTKPQIEMSNIIGRPIMIELIEEPDEKNPTKTYIRVGGIGLAMYHIKDPRVKGWPVNQTIFNQNAAKVGDWVAETKKETRKPAAAAAGAVDPFLGTI